MYGRKRAQSVDLDETKQEGQEEELIQYVVTKNEYRLSEQPFSIVQDYIFCSLDVASVKKAYAQRPKEEKLTEDQTALLHLVISAKSLHDFLIAVQMISNYTPPLFSSKTKAELMKDYLKENYFNVDNGYQSLPTYIEDLIENEKMIKSLNKEFNINQNELITMGDVMKKYDQCIGVLKKKIDEEKNPRSKKLIKLNAVSRIFNDHLDHQNAVYADSCNSCIYDLHKLKDKHIAAEVEEKEHREAKHYEIVKIVNTRIKPHEKEILTYVQENEWLKLKEKLEEYRNKILYKVGFDKFIEKDERSYATTKRREEFGRSKHELSRRQTVRSAPEIAAEFSESVEHKPSKQPRKSIFFDIANAKSDKKTSVDMDDDKHKKTTTKTRASKF